MCFFSILYSLFGNFEPSLIIAKQPSSIFVHQHWWLIMTITIILLYIPHRVGYFSIFFYDLLTCASCHSLVTSPASSFVLCCDWGTAGGPEARRAVPGTSDSRSGSPLGYGQWLLGGYPAVVLGWKGGPLKGEQLPGGFWPASLIMVNHG